jgi:hypothetical protein
MMARVVLQPTTREREFTRLFVHCSEHRGNIKVRQITASSRRFSAYRSEDSKERPCWVRRASSIAALKRLGVVPKTIRVKPRTVPHDGHSCRLAEAEPPGCVSQSKGTSTPSSVEAADNLPPRLHAEGVTDP